MTTKKTDTLVADDVALETKAQADEAIKKSAEESKAAEGQAKRIEELEAKLAEAEAKEKAQDKLEAAAKRVTKVVNAAEPSGEMIQCLQRRKNGTRVAFGNNEATQVEYHFKPINPEIPGSPHVCEVDNEEHADRFLSIREAYRLYRGDDAYADKIPVTKGSDADEGKFTNRFDDILSIDFETAGNDVVAKWSKEVLELTNSQSAQIRKKAKSLDVEVKKGDNMTEVLRNIGKAMQAEEKAASDQASKDK